MIRFRSLAIGLPILSSEEINMLREEVERIQTDNYALKGEYVELISENRSSTPTSVRSQTLNEFGPRVRRFLRPSTG